jgi:hypothetical protein
MADGSPSRLELSDSDKLALTSVGHDLLQETVAKLYGRGIPRARIARILLDHLVPNGKDRPSDQRLSQARTKLRRWETSQKFRDLVYKHAVVELDLEIPGIIKGVSKQARKGKVDAARLALEITGRHNPKGDQAPTQVAVVFQGIPRPDGRTTEETAVEIVREMEDEAGSS